MFLKIQQFVLFATIIVLSSCKEKRSELIEITAAQVSITDTITKTESIETFVLPYRNRIDEVLDSVLAFAPNTISKEDGRYNTTAGNLMADIVMEQANPIFKLRTGNQIDFVLLNHGGIRSVISQGPVTARTAYEVMPFENNIAVVELSGPSVLELITYLISSKRAHPIAGMQIVLDQKGQLKTLTIGNKEFNKNRNYWVATTDYLVNGGDSMVFFKDALAVTPIDYLIRNAMIDYFKKVDTIAPIIDDRYYSLE